MPYLIDGHNLIPKLPGLSLRAVDDELQLIDWLKNFARSERRQVEVFFDGAPPGFSGSRRYGRVTAHFIRQGRTADEAIRLRLRQLGKAARNWTVVSSDHQVQAEARAAAAQVLSSEEFAGQLSRSVQVERGSPQGSPGELGPQDLREWLDLFGEESDRDN